MNVSTCWEVFDISPQLFVRSLLNILFPLLLRITRGIHQPWLNVVHISVSWCCLFMCGAEFSCPLSECIPFASTFSLRIGRLLKLLPSDYFTVGCQIFRGGAQYGFISPYYSSGPEKFCACFFKIISFFYTNFILRFKIFPCMVPLSPFFVSHFMMVFFNNESITLTVIVRLFL